MIQCKLKAKKEVQTRNYTDVMKKMGIDTSSFKKYENAEKYARSFKKSTIQKHVQVSFGANTI